MVTVTQYLKNLDMQLLMMSKTDENLIERLKQQQKDKAEIEHRYKINKAYEEKLAAIKKEEQRHLRASKRVPKTFEHKYEMDIQSEKQIKSAQESNTKIFDDLDSVNSSPDNISPKDPSAAT